MKKYLLILSMAIGLSSCNDFLETESFTSLNTGNFPTAASDARDLLTGAYAAQVAGLPNHVRSNPYFLSECASDERLGGGGKLAMNVQSLDKLMVQAVDEHRPFWLIRYKGINRANMIIETIDQCKGFKTEADKNQVLGEAYFLRAYFYWELAQVFENVPMPIKTTDLSQKQAPVDVLYAQIGSDFIKAIELMGRDKYSTAKSGLATVWAAEGFLARTFLFYTGFYEKDSMPLNDGGSLSKAKMAEYLEDCIANSGHGLVSDFRNLWAYSNVHTGKDWDYSKENNLKWEGDNNKEIIYSYKFGKGGGPANFFYVWQGLPTKISGVQLFPYGGGWAMGSVCPAIAEDWKAEEARTGEEDLRRVGSILDLEEELPIWLPTDGTGGWNSWEETLYRAKKFMNTVSATKYNEDGSINSVNNIFTVAQYGANNAITAGQVTDFPLMRFADILLMHSEITGTADGMNQVRARAGLSPVAYSLENIQKERRWELSFEGVRWNDTRRWHIVENLLGNQVGIDVYNTGAERKMPGDIGGGYVARYKATRGFFMIPGTEIDLSNGDMIQNQGWNEGDNYLYAGWE